jgi:hypothetical protein
MVERCSAFAVECDKPFSTAPIILAFDDFARDAVRQQYLLGVFW